MGDRPARRRRVIIEDARRNGHYLRTTWHPESRQFVVSTWRDDVCTGAARLSAAEGADLAALLVDGLAEAADVPPAGRVPGTAPRDRADGGVLAAARAAAVRVREPLRAWWRRVASPGTPTSPPQPSAAPPDRPRRSA